MNNRRKLLVGLGAGALVAPFGSIRRRFLIALGAGTLLAPLQLFAQRTAGVATVGVLSTGSLQDWELASLRRGLRERGWNEGQNLVLDIRSAMAVRN
jgi:hypothetical protein